MGGLLGGPRRLALEGLAIADWRGQFLEPALLFHKFANGPHDIRRLDDLVGRDALLAVLGEHLPAWQEAYMTISLSSLE